jgi:hypothetical protein
MLLFANLSDTLMFSVMKSGAGGIWAVSSLFHSRFSLLDSNKAQPERLAEVVGSTPTLSIFSYEGTTALNQVCSREL